MNKFFSYSDMRRILLEAILLSTLAFTVGVSINYSLIINAFSGKALSEQIKEVSKAVKKGQATNLYPEPIELEEVKELLSRGALVIDARNIHAYRAGHIAGSIAFPLGEFDSRIVDFRTRVEKKQALIVYCNGFDCPDSFDLGLLLSQEGYQRVLVYEGGFPEWRDAGLPIEVDP